MIQNKTEIFVIPTGVLDTNSIVISRCEECVIFDPSGPAHDWFEFLTDNNLTPRAIYLTHGHYDHIEAVADLIARFNIPWCMNPSDSLILGLNNPFGWIFGGKKIKRPKTSFVPIQNKDLEILPGLIMEFISTPGHSPGSGCFYFKDLNLLISGDTVFAETVGRCDLPLGSWSEMQKSIAKIKSLGLPDGTRVIPGHGPESSMAEIKKENRFFQ